MMSSRFERGIIGGASPAQLSKLRNGLISRINSLIRKHSASRAQGGALPRRAYSRVPAPIRGSTRYINGGRGGRGRAKARRFFRNFGRVVKKGAKAVGRILTTDTAKKITRALRTSPGISHFIPEPVHAVAHALGYGKKKKGQSLRNVIQGLENGSAYLSRMRENGLQDEMDGATSSLLTIQNELKGMKKAFGFGRKKPQSAKQKRRSALVKKLMRQHGMSLPEASHYIKANNLKY